MIDSTQPSSRNVSTTILNNRKTNKRTVVVYLNCGDPSVTITLSLIMDCANIGVDIIELGVPFLDSFTDGETVVRSHQRAVDNGIDFEKTIQLVRELRKECDIPIVLLVDFSFTVKQRSLDTILKSCKSAGVQATLIHGLPPMYRKEYIRLSQLYDIETVFSLYPNATAETINDVVRDSQGFIYLVSKYGRTGGSIDFNSKIIKDFYHNVRTKTDSPLLAGFGISGSNDINTIYSNSDVDGVIIGSAITKLISSLESNIKLQQAVADYLTPIVRTKNTPYLGALA